MASKGAGTSRTVGGFTLLEVILAVGILAAVSTVTYLSFTTVVQAWRKGVTLSDRLQHGDFVMEQLVMALRSAYYPDARGTQTRYGFWVEDEGDGQDVSDRISWVKLGSALVGRSAVFAGTPHRVEFFVEEDDRGDSLAMVKAWRLEGQPEDFDPDEDVAPFSISRQIAGFNCRTLMPADITTDGDLEWQDEWNYTNDLPVAVELTLYLTPMERDGEAAEIKRIVEVPIAYLSAPWVRTGGLTEEAIEEGAPQP